MVGLNPCLAIPKDIVIGNCSDYADEGNEEKGEETHSDHTYTPTPEDSSSLRDDRSEAACEEKGSVRAKSDSFCARLRPQTVKACLTPSLPTQTKLPALLAPCLCFPLHTRVIDEGRDGPEALDCCDTSRTPIRFVVESHIGGKCADLNFDARGYTQVPLDALVARANRRFFLLDGGYPVIIVILVLVFSSRGK